MFRPKEEPVHFNGVFLTANSFISRLSEAGVTLKTEAPPETEAVKTVAHRHED